MVFHLNVFTDLFAASQLYFTAFHCHPIKSKSSVEWTLTAISIPSLRNTLSQSCLSKRNLMNSVTNMDNTVHLWCKWTLHTTNLVLLDICISSAFGIDFDSNWNIKKNTEINAVCLTLKVMQREHLVDLGKYKYVTGLSKQEKHMLKKTHYLIAFSLPCATSRQETENCWQSISCLGIIVLLLYTCISQHSQPSVPHLWEQIALWVCDKKYQQQQHSYAWGWFPRARK